jgi:hypothetical protein
MNYQELSAFESLDKETQESFLRIRKEKYVKLIERECDNWERLYMEEVRKHRKISKVMDVQNQAVKSQD